MRSNRASVERGIREMWDSLALSDGQVEEGTHEAARTIEKNAMEQLAQQEQMEEAAPDMYEALKLAEIRLGDAIRIFQPKGQDLADLQAAQTKALKAIAKAEVVK